MIGNSEGVMMQKHLNLVVCLNLTWTDMNNMNVVLGSIKILIQEHIVPGKIRFCHIVQWDSNW